MLVFLADDRAWLRTVLRLLLEQVQKMEVVGEWGQAESLSDQVKVLHPDLVLLDWDLPGLNTIGARKQLIAALRAVQPQVYILVLCRNSTEPSLLLSSGADAFVSTMEPSTRLMAALEQARHAGDKTCRHLFQYIKDRAVPDGLFGMLHSLGCRQCASHFKNYSARMRSSAVSAPTTGPSGSWSIAASM